MIVHRGWRGPEQSVQRSNTVYGGKNVHRGSLGHIKWKGRCGWVVGVVYKMFSLLEDADLPVSNRVPWLPERLGVVPHPLLFLWAEHHSRVVKI